MCTRPSPQLWEAGAGDEAKERAWYTLCAHASIIHGTLIAMTSLDGN